MKHLLPILLLTLVAPTQAQDHASHEALGTVHFITTCAPTVQPEFNRAVALMHSFQFARAIQSFNTILTQDPTCSMANWGIALSNWGNPFGANQKAQTQLDAGLKATEAARAQHPKSPREHDYIEAASLLYTNAATIPQHTRMVAYEKAMATLSAAYPEDTEAAIFYALSLASAADPADKTYADQLKAGAILDKLFAQYPDHPGLAHYIIHTYDVPALADRAVNAAQRYGAIAPDTAHALHMPSHTFTRVGNWQASIDTNILSAASARKLHQPADELHADDYLVYAYLQTGQNKAALAVVQSAAEAFTHFDPKMTIGGAASPSAAYFAHAAIPARYALERADWPAAAKLEVLSTAFAYTDAITYFARGLGAAHTGDIEAAKSAIACLAEIHDKLVAAKEMYWALQVEIQHQEVAAQLAFTQGDKAGAITTMREAATLEDKTEKNAVTPGPLAPARELLAELLLANNQPAEAQKEFEATLTKEPNRLRSLTGATKAAEAAGNKAAAQAHQSQLEKITAKSDHST